VRAAEVTKGGRKMAPVREMDEGRVWSHAFMPRLAWPASSSSKHTRTKTNSGAAVITVWRRRNGGGRVPGQGDGKREGKKEMWHGRPECTLHPADFSFFSSSMECLKLVHSFS
jgi:hypothetical protein